MGLGMKLTEDATPPILQRSLATKPQKSQKFSLLKVSRYALAHLALCVTWRILYLDYAQLQRRYMQYEILYCWHNCWHNCLSVAKVVPRNALICPHNSQQMLKRHNHAWVYFTAALASPLLTNHLPQCSPLMRLPAHQTLPNITTEKRPDRTW